MMEMNYDIFDSLTNVACRIANKDVSLQWIEENQFYTDGEIIYLSKIMKERYEALCGIIAHEAGHISYGSFKIISSELAKAWKAETDVRLIQEIANVCEDFRVDSINKEYLPGFARDLEDYKKEERLIEKAIKSVRESENLLGYIYLYLYDEIILNTIPNLNNDELRRLKSNKYHMISRLTIRSSIIAIKTIYDIIKNHVKPEDRGKEKKPIEDGESGMIPPMETPKPEADEGNEGGEKEEKSKDGLKKLIEMMGGKGESESGEDKKEFISKQWHPLSKALEEAAGEAIASEILKELENEHDEEMKENAEDIKNIKKGFGMKESEKIYNGKSVEEIPIEFNKMHDSQLPKFTDILDKHSNLIENLKIAFLDLKNQSGIDNYQKRGRINKGLTRAYVSNWKYDRFYSRKIVDQELRILIMVDISGSMGSEDDSKLAVAKEALVLFAQVFESVAELRIVCFTGCVNAKNIILKDWNEELTEEKADLFSLDKREYENLDGLSILHESKNLDYDDYIIVISDGQPSGIGYGLNNCIADLEQVHNKMFAFSIDASGSYLEMMYGNSYSIVSSYEKDSLSENMIEIAETIVREFKNL